METKQNWEKKASEIDEFGAHSRFCKFVMINSVAL
jgi:hypothetical protein